MNNQFDERLTNRIREVFDNYEDDSAHQGWMELRKKYPVKQKPSPIIYWIGSAAAILILASGLWLSLSKKPDGETRLARAALKQAVPKGEIRTEVQSPILPEPGIDAEEQKTDLDKKRGKTSDRLTPRRDGLYQEKMAIAEVTPTDNSLNTEPIASIPDKSIEAPYPISEPARAVRAGKIAHAPQTIIARSHREKRFSGDEAYADNRIYRNNTPQLASKKDGITGNQIANIPLLPEVASASSEAFLSENQQKNTQYATSLPLGNANESQARRSLLDLALEEDKSKKIETDKATPEKKVTFGVYAGSFISYAAGSDNKVNLGAGFSSDIALSRKLQLSTGISITQNTLSFNGRNDIPTAAKNSFQTVAYDKSEKFSIRQPVYSLDKYDANFVGLDIPINLKYTLSEHKNTVFLSAGFSSGTFITESYTYHYNSINFANSSLPESAGTVYTRNENKTEKNLNSFDIARMLNLSFGVAYPLGKQHKLVIEPFIKHPLKEIGEEKLRFGAGGVNLKLNFQAPKK